MVPRTRKMLNRPSYRGISFESGVSLLTSGGDMRTRHLVNRSSHHPNYPARTRSAR